MADLRCSKCGSEKLKWYKYDAANCYRCLNCGYDSCMMYVDLPEQKTSQREKRRFNPYKAGRK